MQPTPVKDTTRNETVLAVSLELAKGNWKIALHDGQREKPAVHTVESEVAIQRLEEAITVIETARRRGDNVCPRWIIPADRRW